MFFPCSLLWICRFDIFLSNPYFSSVSIVCGMQQVPPSSTIKEVSNSIGGNSISNDPLPQQQQSTTSGTIIRVYPEDGSPTGTPGSDTFTLRLTNGEFGKGSFGTVYEASIVETGEIVAVKKVFQDRRFRNRELQVIKQLNHPNIVKLKHYFYQTSEKV